MTASSPYQAYPGPAPALVISPSSILVAVADPTPQRRVTVFFRLLLALPHLFVLYFLNLGAAVVAFIGWWGALFTGRLPQFAVTYLSGMLRWSARVYAYCYLLTDVYPPFSYDDDPTYPVRVAIPEPQRLNRAAVLFRYFLAIPVTIVIEVAMLGAGTLMAFIAWLVALVAGQLPSSFYLAYVAILRFITRYYGYWWMLTPAYPASLYGDEPGAVAWADQPPTAEAQGFGTPAPGFGPGSAYGNPVDSAPQGYGSPQGYGTPQGYDAPGYGAPAGYGAPTPGYGAPAGYGAPGGYGVRPVFQPTTWRLTLTSAAKGMITTFIAIGSLVILAYMAAVFVFANSTAGSVSSTGTAIAALDQLNGSYDTLSNNLNAWEQATTDCDQNLTCVTKQDTKAAGAFHTFSAQVAGMSVPAGASADQAKLVAAATAAEQDFIQLSKSTSVSQYQSTIDRVGLEQTLNGIDQDVTTFTKSLQDQLP